MQYEPAASGAAEPGADTIACVCSTRSGPYAASIGVLPRKVADTCGRPRPPGRPCARPVAASRRLQARSCHQASRRPPHSWPRPEPACGGWGAASRASARREGWHIGRRGQLADVGGHGARVQPAQEGHCGARRMLPLQRSRGRGGDARDGFLGRQALRPPQQPSALPARVLGNGWVHLPAARRSAPLQVLRSRARDPARSGITPNRPRSGAPAGRRRHRRRMRHAHQVVHGLKPPTRACWRTSAGHCTSSVRGSGCAGACTAAVATMHAAVTAPCRLAPAARHLPPRAQRLCLGGDAAVHAVLRVSPPRYAAAAPAEPRSADASRACLLWVGGGALLSTHPHDLQC